MLSGYRARALLALSGCAALGYAPLLLAATPVLFSQPAYESPVAAEGDDLLLLAGAALTGDDTVIYRALNADGGPPQHPTDAPRSSDAVQGVAEIVDAANAPGSLSIRLPRPFDPDRSYALWVRSAHGEWSQPVRLNDVRPLWLTPASVNASVPVPGLAREVKIVGRNLQSGTTHPLQVRLIGPETQTVSIAAPPPTEANLSRYVAQVRLPASLRPGDYRIAVRRDADWVELPTQRLMVRPDPAPPAEFPVGGSEAGDCHANDHRDVRACIRRAIAAAEAHGGGTVTFGPGRWEISGSADGDPMRVPPAVNLQGAGASETQLVRQSDAPRDHRGALFALLGHNRVQGFSFVDEQHYQSDARAPLLLLGAPRGEPPVGAAADAGLVDQITITGNVFRNTNPAVSDSGAPIRSLVITHNEFGAYAIDLELGGNPSVMTQTFRVEDSIIAHNLFKPGAHLDLQGSSGPLASELGAAYRVDFSDNQADGTATDYLYAADQPRGWRAAFFWNLTGPQESVLVAQNSVSCTDRIGDGEAIAFDNNGNTFAFDAAQTVLAASADSVTVGGPLLETQNNRRLPADYYVGHWVQVGAGPGTGQVRRIESYRSDPATRRVTFKVAPAWDVVPAAGTSRINAGRGYWQIYVLGNTVDNRRPRCTHHNLSRVKAGMVGFWAQAADSVIALNRLYDSDGISLHEFYSATGPECPSCNHETYYVSFVEVRDNLISGEYDWDDDCSSSGIVNSVAASPAPFSPPPTLGMGISIAHNVVDRADGEYGGGIAFVPAWYQGPPPNRWPLLESVLIHHNQLTGMSGAPIKACRQGTQRPRIAINAGSTQLISHTVLYANRCEKATQPLSVGQQEVVRVCDADAPPSCECAASTPP